MRPVQPPPMKIDFNRRRVGRPYVSTVVRVSVRWCMHVMMIVRTCARARHYQFLASILAVIVLVHNIHLPSLRCLEVILGTLRGEGTQVRITYLFNLFSSSS